MERIALPDLSNYPSNLVRELHTALLAAQEAGRILDAAFLSPGGAAGHGAKSPVDTEAESMIRRRLDAAFPDYGIRGEELPGLDRLPGAGGRVVPEGAPRWFVDPNDGTDAYLSGRRGASVSIGLVRGDRPVLGVVFAYAARSGFGDLFFWAEGGPLMRNGSVVPPGRRVRVSGKAIALSSGGADTASLANLSSCSPARVRAEPSIAYRLALAAAGEADVAMSIYGPHDYDVAAGHALLLGAGGDLYSAGGLPIRYASSASAGGAWARVGDCFGGTGGLPAEFSRRDWSALRQARHARHPEYPFVKSDRALVCPDHALLDRACGSLLGMVAGDSLGSLAEFRSSAEIAASYPAGGPDELADGGTWGTIAGQPTDDSELGILLGRSIVKGSGYDPEEAARAYAYWHDTEPFDEGATTRAAFEAACMAWKSGSPSVAEAARRGASAMAGSQANGALMRLAPLAVYAHALEDGIIADLAARDAALSHANPVCQAANAAFAVALAALVRGETRRDAVERANAALSRDEASAWRDGAPAVAACLESAMGTGPVADAGSGQGWVLVALGNAIHRLLTGQGMAEAAIETVRMGGDTDTNAAIAGALLGAADGADLVPIQWKSAILSCRPGPGWCLRPRPEPLWPVDIMRLAERLVVLGGKNGGERWRSGR